MAMVKYLVTTRDKTIEVWHSVGLLWLFGSSASTLFIFHFSICITSSATLFSISKSATTVSTIITFEHPQGHKDTIAKMSPRLAGAKRMAFAVFSNTCPKNDTKRQAIEKNLENKGIAIRFCRTGKAYQLERWYLRYPREKKAKKRNHILPHLHILHCPFFHPSSWVLWRSGKPINQLLRLWQSLGDSSSKPQYTRAFISFLHLPIDSKKQFKLTVHTI